MRISAEGIALIKRFEGLRLVAYVCPGGVPTIGYGHTRTVTAADVAAGRQISEIEADRLLAEDLAAFEAGVLRLCTRAPTQAQFDALVSLAYNIGLSALGRSTLLRLHNSGDHLRAAAQFLEWDNARGADGQLRQLRGLTRRRRAEADLYARMLETLPAPAPESVTPVLVGIGGAGAVTGAAIGALAVYTQPAADAAWQIWPGAAIMAAVVAVAVIGTLVAIAVWLRRHD